MQNRGINFKKHSNKLLGLSFHRFYLLLTRTPQQTDTIIWIQHDDDDGTAETKLPTKKRTSDYIKKHFNKEENPVNEGTNNIRQPTNRTSIRFSLWAPSRPKSTWLKVWCPYTRICLHTTYHIFLVAFENELKHYYIVMKSSKRRNTERFT